MNRMDPIKFRYEYKRSELYLNKEKKFWHSLLMAETIMRPIPGSEDEKEIQLIKKLLNDENYSLWIVERFPSEDGEQLTISSQNLVCYSIHKNYVDNFELISFIFELLGKR